MAGANTSPRRLRHPGAGARGALDAAAAPGDCAASPAAPERPMAAILAIAIFILVLAGLNKYEFGRFD
ncbi:MAG TPA: hypothetical protein VMU93_10620 [Caulobacteraceae bacterium]|nr:hypothetical protein [Caulobacteraceae bacterium]